MAGDSTAVSLAQLLAADVRVEPSDAVAIVREISAGDETRAVVPLTPGKIWLHPDATLSVSGNAARSVGDVGCLLEVLLESVRRTGSSRLPGPLLYTMARATGQVDAPPFDSVSALSEALARFDTRDHSSVFRDLLSRWNQNQMDSPGADAPPADLAPESSNVHEPPLFETRTVRRRLPLGAGWVAVAAAVGLPAGIMIALATPSLIREPVLDRVGVSAEGTTGVAEPEPRVERLVDSDVVAADALFSPSFGQTGTAVFFHAQGKEGSALKRADTSADGEVLHIATIVDDGAKNYHVQLSPDGSSVAFDSDRDGVRGVYIAAADGKGVRRVSGEGYSAVPRWSPDSHRLSFLRAEARRGSVWNLWVLDLRSGKLDRLTDYSNGQVWGGSWFPDGARIAYSHEDQLVVLDIPTNHSRIFPSPQKGRLIRTPAVSPNGRWVIFQVFQDGGWLLDLDSGLFQRVLDDPSAEEFTWSPDGRQVAFHSRRSGEWGLWKMAPR